jgi:peptidoglycan/LPS O-acetylase OafA/YrhL
LEHKVVIMSAPERVDRVVAVVGLALGLSAVAVWLWSPTKLEETLFIDWVAIALTPFLLVGAVIISVRHIRRHPGGRRGWITVGLVLVGLAGAVNIIFLDPILNADGKSAFDELTQMFSGGPQFMFSSLALCACSLGSLRNLSDTDPDRSLSPPGSGP